MPLTYGLIKLSVLFLYRRLFFGTVFRWYSLAVLILLASWSIAFFFAFAFQCGTHPQYWWTSVETIQKYCSRDDISSLVFAVTDVFTDLLVLATPIPIIWKLQMSRTNKIGLSFIFMLGLL